VRREDFETLIRAHQAELYRYLRYLGADRTSAEDLVQDVFVAVLRARRVPEMDRAAAWLRGIARNLFLQWCRRKRSGVVRADSETVEKAESTWRSVFLRSGDGFDYVEALRKCSKQLPEKHRRLLDQRYGRKMSRAEMARAASMSENGVKSLLRRIRAALAECIKRRLRVEGVPRG